MRGILYAVEWLEPEFEEPPSPLVIVSRTRALWVPDAGLLFQRPEPTGTIQVTQAVVFPPADGSKARVFARGECTVPYTTVREARRYLKQQLHVQAQEAVVQKAMDRLTEQAVYNESRFQRLTQPQIQL